MPKSRAERLISNAKDDMDAVVIVNDGEPFLDSTFWYLTEQKSGTFEGSFAIVRPDGNLDVIVSILEEEGARRAPTTASGMCACTITARSATTSSGTL